MRYFKSFCMKKRAGLLRHTNLDQEYIRQFACAHLVVGNIGLAYRVPIAAILDKKRGRHRVSEARQVSQYLCHISFQQPLSIIGKIFKRDRTSVAHACQRIEGLRDEAQQDLAIDCLEWGVMSLAESLQLTKESKIC